MLAAGTLLTAQGQNLTVAAGTPSPYINNYAQITTVDILCSNGIVHLIDTVLISSATSLVNVATLAGLTTLTSLVTSAGLAPTLSNVATRGAFTVLAPTNAAFTAFGTTNVGSWVTNARNAASVAAVLQYHVVAGAVFSRQLTNAQVVTMLNTQTTTVGVSGATVTFSDNQTPRGVATVTIADAAAYNGVAHVIDRVLVPAGLPWAALQDVVNLAIATPTLSTLVAQVTTAGLVAALEVPNGPFTVLAPNNNAFSAASGLPTAQAAVATLLQGHVIAGRLYAADLRNQTYTTLAGTTVQCVVTGAGVQFTGAGVTVNVIAANNDASNGVVHIIDRVIIAPGPSPSPQSGAAAAGASLVALAIAAAAAVAAF